MNYWYVIYTRSKFEKKCNDLLLRKGYTTYLPLQRVKRKWSDRIKEVEVPLLSGYIFLNCNSFQFVDILKTDGVVCFIKFDKEFARVPEKQIEALKNAISINNSVEVVDNELIPGQEVYITSGPFKDNYARLVQLKGKGKLLLSIDCIGKGIILELGRTRVEPMSQIQKTA